jgi:hypothetical protein
MPDKDVLDAFLEIARLIGAPNISILEYAAERNENPKLEEVSLEHYSSTEILRISNISLGVANFSMTFTRSSGNEPDLVFFDTLRIAHQQRHNGSHEVSQEQVRRIQDIVAKLSFRDNGHVAGLFRNPKLFRDLLASHHRQNVQLQQMVLDVGKQAAEVRTQLETEFGRRQIQLQENMARLAKERESAFDIRLNTLVERELELATRQKEVDDRNNTHARRELHKALKARITERAASLKVTPDTTRNRIPIHITVAAVTAVLAVLVFYHSAALAQLPADASLTQIVILAVKPAALTIAMLGIVAWYLRWLNRWFERYADAEFHLKQFELDIDRASWVVEAALEWRLSQDKPMPEHLLETISRNLFSKSEKDESADMHPADYLASAILGRASALNLKVPGGEISFSGRDMKKLQKDAAEA